jgi:hypothetical protein
MQSGVAEVKKILLPDSWFGFLMTLFLIALVCIVPFVVALWLTLLVAPWWVAVPIALAASLASFLVSVKFKE